MTKITGRGLNEKWKVGALHALYRQDGSWYHTLTKFPGALFDEHGFLWFETKQDYEECPYLTRGKRDGTNWLGLKHGTIAKTPGYRAFDFMSFVNNVESFASGKTENELWEGGKTTVVVNRYERDPKARDACIKMFGAKCSVCEFDFLRTYGKIGQGRIHVHHLRPLSEIKERYKLNPATDLRPVCPNCHEMLHVKKPEPYTIEELKGMLMFEIERATV